MRYNWRSGVTRNFDVLIVDDRFLYVLCAILSCLCGRAWFFIDWKKDQNQLEMSFEPSIGFIVAIRLIPAENFISFGRRNHYRCQLKRRTMQTKSEEQTDFSS